MAKQTKTVKKDSSAAAAAAALLAAAAAAAVEEKEAVALSTESADAPQTEELVTAKVEQSSDAVAAADCSEFVKQIIDADILDTQEALSTYIDKFEQLSLGTSVTLSELIKQNVSFILTQGIRTIPIMDNSMPIDGAFFQFLDSVGVKYSICSGNCLSVLPYSASQSDPFIFNGMIKCETVSEDGKEDDGGFKFYKSSELCKNGNADVPVSIVFIEPKNYNKYFELKGKYVDFIQKRDGVSVKVIGGEEYIQPLGFGYSKLFFGENTKFVDTIKETLSNFINSKQQYKSGMIPWSYSMLFTGAVGTGKSYLVNSIISELGYQGITINFYNVDDSVLTAAFDYAKTREKVVLFVEDVDELLKENFITIENVISLVSNFDSNNGSIVIFTARKVPDLLKMVFGVFDSIYELPEPTHTTSVDYLFGEHLEKDDLDKVKKLCATYKFSYASMFKIYKLFVKNNIRLQLSKSTRDKQLNFGKSTDFGQKDNFSAISHYIEKINVETAKIKEKVKPRKIGLLEK